MENADNLRDTELRLGLPGTADSPAAKGSKRALSGDGEKSNSSSSPSSSGDDSGRGRESTAPVVEPQVVGWPPIRSNRKNSFQAARKAAGSGLYVKVSMDGAPYLRKIDLNVYRGYKELRDALDDMFKCFSSPEGGEVSGIEWNNGANDQYATAYEDKDGDLMLVGDVPWEMFICSCKKLRMMKESEARGLGSKQ